MGRKRAQKASLLVLLHLVQSILIVHSLSISSSTKNALTAASARNIQSAAGHQAQQQQITTLPPLVTTISQNNYLDPLAAQQQQQQLKQEVGLHSSGGEHRSSSEEHEESIPLATINNHSRNNQPAVRPPQYVDVSALVGVSLVELIDEVEDL